MEKVIDSMVGFLKFRSEAGLKEVSIDDLKRQGAQLIPGSWLVEKPEEESMLVIPLAHFEGSYKLDEKGHLEVDVRVEDFDLEEAFAFFEDQEEMEDEEALLPRLKDILMDETLDGYELTELFVQHNFPVKMTLESAVLSYDGKRYEFSIDPEVQGQVNDMIHFA